MTDFYGKGKTFLSKGQYDKAIECYKLGIEQADARCWYGYGCCLKNGDGVEKDYDKGLEIIKANYEAILELANAGDAWSILAIAFYYYNGWVVKKDLQAFFAWAKKSAEAENSEGMWRLGYAYEFGEGTEIDLKKAFEWYKKSAEAENSEGMWRLGRAYEKGKGTEKNLKKAFEWYKKSAKAENSQGMWLLGCAYEDDLTKAFEWYKKSAEAGNDYGALFLASTYEQGEGTEIDLTKAFEWYKKSAEAGNDEGMMRLGFAYEKGKGTDIDLTKAFEWYKKSAEAGNDEGMMRLGFAYEKGNGTDIDLTKAFEWYKKSAETGNSDAMWYLAVAYERGRCTEKNLEEAFKWYKKSAEAGNSDAMWKLADAYEKGKGTEIDLQKSFEWLKKSAETGNAFGTGLFAHAYICGRGVEKDYQKALEYAGICATYNSGIGYSFIAKEYLKGKYLEQDYNKARELYEKATSLEEDSDFAFAGLAYLYENGYGVEKNPQLMVEYLQKSFLAYNNNAEVCYKLGYAYYDGNGVEQDLEKAKELFEKALSLGYHCSYRLSIVKEALGEEIKDNPMRLYAETLSKKNLKPSKIHALVEKDLQKDFGKTWDKLNENTKVFLSTAMTTFISLYSVGPHARGDLDFSSAISPMFKALEMEISQYLFSGYMEYLTSNNVDPSQFINEKRFFVIPYENRYLSPDKATVFTLGKIKELMGLKKKNSFSLNKRVSSTEEVSIDKAMFDYLKEKVRDTAFSLYEDRELAEYFMGLAQTIDDMTRDKRNRAAHKDILSCKIAEQCGNQIIKSQKILKTFVDMFK